MHDLLHTMENTNDIPTNEIKQRKTLTRDTDIPKRDQTSQKDSLNNK